MHIVLGTISNVRGEQELRSGTGRESGCGDGGEAILVSKEENAAGLSARGNSSVEGLFSQVCQFDNPD